MARKKPTVNRRRFLTAAGGTGVVSLAGCLDDDESNGDGADEEQSLFIGSVYTGGHPINEMAMDWAETVADETDGAVDITIDEDFGGEGDLLEQTEIGSIEGSLVGALWVDLYAPEVYWMECPFVFEDWDQQYRAFMESEYGEIAFDAAIDQGNQRVIGEPVYRGARLLTANEAVADPENLSGLTVRVPELDAWVQIWDGLGADTSTIAFDELYSALEQGVADAQENPAEDIEAMSLYEVQSHLMLTQHLVSTGWMTINEDIWQNLSQDHQETLESTFTEAVEDLGDEIATVEDESITTLEEDRGMEVVETNTDDWLELAEPTLEDLFESQWEGTLEEAREI